MSKIRGTFQSSICIYGNPPRAFQVCMEKLRWLKKKSEEFWYVVNEVVKQV